MMGVDLNKDSEDAEDLEIINSHAKELNEEAADVLEYQVTSAGSHWHVLTASLEQGDPR